MEVEMKVGDLKKILETMSYDDEVEVEIDGRRRQLTTSTWVKTTFNKFDVQEKTLVLETRY
jgi:hypothetical protein